MEMRSSLEKKPKRDTGACETGGYYHCHCCQDGQTRVGAVVREDGEFDSEVDHSADAYYGHRDQVAIVDGFVALVFLASPSEEQKSWKPSTITERGQLATYGLRPKGFDVDECFFLRDKKGLPGKFRRRTTMSSRRDKELVFLAIVQVLVKGEGRGGRGKGGKDREEGGEGEAVPTFSDEPKWRVSPRKGSVEKQFGTLNASDGW
ncbi:hypothetical protein K435DRAFT_801633 [Dendrothele bispora CBS 962.96]|uniref:Uncharacterized protein n=1 Tax=Dendrothele bispora (strain CBS 962.96) TaxID=1314807 RepID=A0A4S8LNM3_DENBC|nr:hypothetical protein K435DRAFT_801633 [Dendrothele bispora CBS 962.96]